MPKPKPVLVLDVDGVVFRSLAASTIVKNRVIEFVRHKTGKSVRDAAALNRRAYSRHGHTILGMRRVVPGIEWSLGDFNRYVYDRELLTIVEKECMYEKESNAAINDFRDFQELVQDTPIYLFSNAPRCWMDMIFNMYELNVPYLNILASDDHWLHMGDDALKPEMRCFGRVQNQIVHDHGKDVRLLMVDDSPINVRTPIMRGSKWDGMVFEKHHTLVHDVLPWMQEKWARSSE